MSDEYKQFIYGDIQREIDLARTGTGGGNLLAALGLLCYTEYLGGLIRGGTFKTKEATRNFNEGFDALGAHYVAFRLKHPVYSIFRCGMVHEYATKKSCEIVMLAGGEEHGVDEHPDARYEFYLCVEAYFRDFKTACERHFPASPSGPAVASSSLVLNRAYSFTVRGGESDALVVPPPPQQRAEPDQRQPR